MKGYTTAALLELLAGTAGARFIAAYLGAAMRGRPEAASHSLSLWFKGTVELERPSNHANSQIVASLRANGFLIGAHFRVIVVLIG
jgi:hypothetical protein